jgi:hypothetical protein
MQVFNENSLKEFEDRMAEYLAKRFSPIWTAKGESAGRKSIQRGIESSRKYGITAENDVARYIDLMYRLGEDFDTSPNTPWAARILENSDFGSSVKMDMLCEQAESQMQLDGPQGMEK